eukprot:TRINITY_DN6783_c1_g1_i1.p1 TRINITY_DN6783_c1_g1~~TRINITY_DN6783_c1_g1_i1.p1  ORF type:complete len:369 (-),score=57.22 TRINITY_DN6783_c1_g1_i1:12-1118(-)
MRYPKSGVRYEGEFVGGEREGEGTLYFPDGSVIKGTFLSGELHGPDIQYIFADGSKIVAFYVAGEMNGAGEEKDNKGALLFAGNYKHSQRHGDGIVYFKDGGSIAGKWKKGELNGPAMYAYPDPRFKLIGKWKKGQMRGAKFLPPTGLDIPDVHDLSVLSAVCESVVYHYDPSLSLEDQQQAPQEASQQICSAPLVPDPYETYTVYVGPSNLPQSGEGLFTRRALHKGELVAFYNGVRVAHTIVDARDWDQNSYTISLDDETVIDLPPPWDSTTQYRASLAHKANTWTRTIPITTPTTTPITTSTTTNTTSVNDATQDTSNNNCQYAHYAHPRFGAIKCIRTLRDLTAGEEILVDYDYHDERPDWYVL